MQHDDKAAVGRERLSGINLENIGLFVDNDFVNCDGCTAPPAPFAEFDTGFVEMPPFFFEFFGVVYLEF